MALALAVTVCSASAVVNNGLDAFWSLYIGGQLQQVAYSTNGTMHKQGATKLSKLLNT